jgi:hypothetical protein
MRRVEIGHYHHIAGAYVLRYAQEHHGAKIISQITSDRGLRE